MLIFIFILCLQQSLAIWNQPYIVTDETESSYMCNCLSKDVPLVEVEKTIPVMLPTPPRPTVQEYFQEKPKAEQVDGDENNPYVSFPSKYWQINRNTPFGAGEDSGSSSYLDKLLSYFRRRQDPIAEPQQDSPQIEAITGMGKRIVTKYFDKIKKEWNLMDRFNCQCEGEILSLFKAKTFISLKITHD